MKYSSVNVTQRKLKTGKRWVARAKYKDLNGEWRDVSKALPEAKGKREAEKIAKEWLEELNAQADLMPNAGKERTVDEVCREYLNYQLNTGIIEKSTYSNNLFNYNKYVSPYIGNYIFALVDRTILNSWLTKLYDSGYSQNLIHTVFATLKKVYNYFYNSGELLRDPFKGVKVPKKGESKVTHLTTEQMDNVLEAVYADYEPQDPMYVGILLAFFAGLRRGEICGLRWNDIDLYKNTITVRSAIGVGDAKGGSSDYSKNPKNKSSNRTFPIMPQLQEALRLRKERIKPQDGWYVIGDKEEFMRPQKYNRQFKEFVERNNLTDAYGKKIVPHGLRHNFATVGIRAGMDISSLALIMGHASRAMTLDTYGDADADAVRVASKKMEETFRENSFFKDIGYPEEETKEDNLIKGD